MGKVQDAQLLRQTHYALYMGKWALRSFRAADAFPGRTRFENGLTRKGEKLWIIQSHAALLAGNWA
jgi:hypothetical protein